MRLIDADKLVLEFIAHFCGDGTEIPPIAQLAVKMLIDAAPTIDPASLRPKGEWEWFEEWLPSTTEHPAECEDCGWRCGKCRRALEDMVGGYWDDPTEKPQLHFCPNCGADMRGNPNDS